MVMDRFQRSSRIWADAVDRYMATVDEARRVARGNGFTLDSATRFASKAWLESLDVIDDISNVWLGGEPGSGVIHTTPPGGSVPNINLVVDASTDAYRTEVATTLPNNANLSSPVRLARISGTEATLPERRVIPSVRNSVLALDLIGAEDEPLQDAAEDEHYVGILYLNAIGGARTALATIHLLRLKGPVEPAG